MSAMQKSSLHHFLASEYIVLSFFIYCCISSWSVISDYKLIMFAETWAVWMFCGLGWKCISTEHIWSFSFLFFLSFSLIKITLKYLLYAVFSNFKQFQFSLKSHRITESTFIFHHQKQISNTKLFLYLCKYFVS